MEAKRNIIPSPCREIGLVCTSTVKSPPIVSFDFALHSPARPSLVFFAVNVVVVDVAMAAEQAMTSLRRQGVYKPSSGYSSHHIIRILVCSFLRSANNFTGLHFDTFLSLFLEYLFYLSSRVKSTILRLFDPIPLQSPV